MIFVTVGSSDFDELAKEIDRLVNTKKIKEKVIIQIGNGKYIPKYCKWFRFSKSLLNYYKKANLIISHEGAATLYEIAQLSKLAIIITNPASINNPDMVKKFSHEGYVLWCKDFTTLMGCIEKSKSFKPKLYTRHNCEIHKIIIKNIKNWENKGTGY